MKVTNQLFRNLSVFVLVIFTVVSSGFSQHMHGNQMQHNQMMQGQKMKSMTDMMNKMHAINKKMDTMLNHLHESMQDQSMQHMQSNFSMKMTHNMDEMAKNMTKFMENMQIMMQDNSIMQNKSLQKHMKEMKEHMKVVTEHMEGVTNNLQAVNRAAEKTK